MGIFLHLQGFYQTVFGEGVEQSIHDGGDKQYERSGNIFGKMGNTEGKIQGKKI